MNPHQLTFSITQPSGLRPIVWVIALASMLRLELLPVYSGGPKSGKGSLSGTVQMSKVMAVQQIGVSIPFDLDNQS